MGFSEEAQRLDNECSDINSDINSIFYFVVDYDPIFKIYK